ncbi:hypothetical protein ACSAZL_08500 [Methanosarcina sp. T3]|uniref:hypothetical protein n=1 Tax=Methanosarcina sp. T3 TaxID=3439062 RepID=UPI003F85FF7B
MTKLKRSHRPQKNQNTGPAVLIRNSPFSGLSGNISIYSEPAVINRKLIIVNKSKIVLVLETFVSELEKLFIE